MLKPEHQEAVDVRNEINNLIDNTDWNRFKAENNFILSIEAKALLMNALKKMNRIIDGGFNESTTHSRSTSETNVAHQ